MKNIKYKFSVMTVMFVAFLGMFAAQAAAKDINGFYIGDGGGAYFIRQIGTKVYWVAEDTKGGWANVFAGTISGTKITGHWWDIPKGKVQGGGDITFEIKNGGASLAKLTSSAPFGSATINVGPPDINVGAVHTSPEEGVIGLLRSRGEGFRSGDNNLTGAWNGDDYATYYVREMPNGDVVWFAENNMWGDPGGDARPTFARVFIGKKIGGLITGEWVDVPKGKATGSGVLGSRLVSQQEIKFNNPPVGIDGTGLTRSMPNSLRGYADLHTHPMVNLGFGGKLIHGAPDVGSIIPADKDCNHNIRAKSIQHALGPATPTHGDPAQIGCGDAFRRAVIFAYEKANDALVTVGSPAQGAPDFTGYPKWNDIAHQKMWVDWVRRSYNAGQRVMVALATTNSTLTAAVSGPGDGPLDDKSSADLQITEIKSFVARHNDFMEVALTAADVRRIVASNKMAIVIGIEIDNIGNFNKFPNFDALPPMVRATMINAEMIRLRNEGVRYVFPIHVLDNKFGGTAVYESLFNYSNKREEGRWWDVRCATKEDFITRKFEPFLGSDIPKEAKDLLSDLSGIKVGLDVNAPTPPKCVNEGHVNGLGLQLNPTDKLKTTGDGQAAINSLMKLGMLIDIDHMSQKGVNDTLGLAEAIPGGYPLVSGHTGLRLYQKTENSRTETQLERIGKLGGMFGLGSADMPANLWAAQYEVANTFISGTNISKNFGDGRVSFGTDLNGLVKGAPPRAGGNLYSTSFPKSHTGNKYWNYRTDGVAHYGMMADFLADVRTEPTHGNKVYASIMKNAEAFAQMWEKAEKEAKMVK